MKHFIEDNITIPEDQEVAWYSSKWCHEAGLLYHDISLPKWSLAVNVVVNRHVVSVYDSLGGQPGPELERFRKLSGGKDG